MLADESRLLDEPAFDLERQLFREALEALAQPFELLGLAWDIDTRW